MNDVEAGLVIRALSSATASGDTLSGDIKGRLHGGVLVWELRRLIVLALPCKGSLNLCKVIKQSSWEAFLRVFGLEIIPSRKTAAARGLDVTGLLAEHYVSTPAMVLLLLHGSVHRHTKKDKEHFTAALIECDRCLRLESCICFCAGWEGPRAATALQTVTMDAIELQLRAADEVLCDVDRQGSRCSYCLLPLREGMFSYCKRMLARKASACFVWRMSDCVVAISALQALSVPSHFTDKSRIVHR
eukprot:1032421-Amphidinium_carterae.1